MGSEPVSVQNPHMLVAGIKQFGLAPDGSDLRDLSAALSAQEEELGRLRAELLIDRAIFDRRWEHDEVKRLDAALEGSKR